MTIRDETTKSINSLLKIAQDMTDMVAPEEGAPAKASPEQVLEAISAVVSELEGIMNSLPVQDQPPTDAPVDTPTEDPKVAKLEKELAELREKDAKRERALIASKIAELYPESERDAKIKELTESKEEISILQAKLEALSEFSEKAATQTAKRTNTFSYQKSAKLANGTAKRLVTL